MAAEDWIPEFWHCNFYDDDCSRPDDYLEMSDEELFATSSGARSEKLKSIRKYYQTHKFMSKKQRYCLAAWISERDNKYV